MQYPEFKENFINKVFIPYMNNEKGSARSNLSNLYRMGKDNPRGTTYQIVNALNDTKDIYNAQAIQLKSAGKNEEAFQVVKNYFSFIKEIFGGKHPLIKSALNDINASMQEVYPDKKTLQFTKFILFKKNYPILSKMKFLARFL